MDGEGETRAENSMQTNEKKEINDEVSITLRGKYTNFKKRKRNDAPTKRIIRGEASGTSPLAAAEGKRGKPAKNSPFF